MALPEPPHGGLAGGSQTLRLWAPPCLAACPCAHFRLQGTNVVATFPAAVGMASPHLPGPESLYLFLPQRLGLRLGAWAPDGLSAWSSCPRCGAKIKGKAAGLRVCVSACPACPWSVTPLVNLGVEPLTSLVPLRSGCTHHPGWQGRVYASPSLWPACVSPRMRPPACFLFQSSEPRAEGSRALPLSSLAPSSPFPDSLAALRAFSQRGRKQGLWVWVGGRSLPTRSVGAGPAVLLGAS